MNLDLNSNRSNRPVNRSEPVARELLNLFEFNRFPPVTGPTGPVNRNRWRGRERKPWSRRGAVVPRRPSRHAGVSSRSLSRNLPWLLPAGVSPSLGSGANSSASSSRPSLYKSSPALPLLTNQSRGGRRRSIKSICLVGFVLGPAKRSEPEPAASSSSFDEGRELG